MKSFLLALVSIALSVAAQFSLKRGMSGAAPVVADSILQGIASSVFRPWVLVGLALYGAGAVVWLFVLARWDVSKAYPLVGLGFVLTLVVGAILGEAVTVARVLGVLLIAGGVYLVSAS